MSAELPEFTPAQESLFLTLGSRALDSRLPQPFLGDRLSDEILVKTGYDVQRFPQLGTDILDQRSKVFDVAVRSRILDEMVRQFVLRHPDAIVLDLGAGLDPRFARVSPPPTVDWYDVDFAEVIALRRKVLPEFANAHLLGADVTDPDWLQSVPDERPAIIVADGLMLFLGKDEFVSLLRRITARFPNGEVILNAYTSSAMWTFKHSRAMAPIAADIASTGLNRPKSLEKWVPGLTLVDQLLLTRTPEVDELPRMARWPLRLAAHSAVLSRMMTTVVLRYRF